MKRTGPSNPILKKTIAELKKQDANLWQRLAIELERATRKRREVNLSKLERFAVAGDTILVPGKVLGAGVLKKRLNVAAWSFSEGAAAAIKKAGGSTLTISELVKKNPKGTGVKVLG
ncbi:MAG: 50S ribosomal protein L18e [Candidatus Nanoarchaeia archaeon]